MIGICVLMILSGVASAQAPVDAPEPLLPTQVEVGAQPGSTPTSETDIERQRALEAKNSHSFSIADATYDALRRYLRASRDELSKSLNELIAAKSTVPGLPDEPVTVGAGSE